MNDEAANEVTSLDAAMTLLFHVAAHCRGGSELIRWDVASITLAASPGWGDMFIVRKFNRDSASSIGAAWQRARRHGGQGAGTADPVRWNEK